MCFRKGNEMRAAVRKLFFLVGFWCRHEWTVRRKDFRNYIMILPTAPTERQSQPFFLFYPSSVSRQILYFFCQGCHMLHSPFQNHHVLFCGNVRFCLYELWNSVSFRLFLLQVCNPRSSLCVPTFRTTPLQIWAISVSIRSVTRSHSGNALPFSTLIVRLAWDFEFV